MGECQRGDRVLKSEAHQIELVEYQTRELERAEFPEKLAQTLHRDYSAQVEVQPPSFITGDKWRLTAQGWVGYIPLSREVTVVLHPKVSVNNLFRMLEYACHLEPRWLKGLVDCNTLEEFYELLARVLVRFVLNRTRKGLYCAYIPESGRLVAVRGRLDTAHLARVPWDPYLFCHYHNHTADIEDNRILLWTLLIIARSGRCTEKTLPAVRKAYHGLHSLVELTPVEPEACIGRKYHRLNQDYEAMHSLCRFFLKHSGPSHTPGSWSMIPFLISMDSLYEEFIANWLEQNLRRLEPGFEVRIQERGDRTGKKGNISYCIDLILYDKASKQPRFVLDTKYKVPYEPSPADIYQIHTYAALKECPEAVLVYPERLERPLDVTIRDIRVRTLCFPLDGDLDQAGERFVQELLA